MRHIVVTLAVLAFAAGMILNWPGVAQLVMFCAAGGCGVPQRGVQLGLASIGMAALMMIAWRWRRRARPRLVTRRLRPASRPAALAAPSGQRRGASRRKA